ncbi:MAG: C40 family peptidase, partial [Lachnospiraceae bacterium]|nr:C40 family peptidase [Lachnospiraceae bacterium]
NSSSNNNGGGNNSSSDNGGANPYQQDADPSPSTDVSGGSVVSYARQFVGNRYVWGGNSLTNGCDCSGFVVQVYRHFGIDLSGHRNSAALRSVGSAVSANNIQPGDIVCYPGHVAIYAGGGLIVEAQSSRAGITCNRTWNHGTVLAIRRVV